jgi:predicted extracellular nuclease
VATAGPPTLAPLEDGGRTAVHNIQGSGRTSPLAGQAATTAGIVTAADSNGFDLQDPVGDGDDITSDGIFVFTGRAPAVRVGDEAEAPARSASSSRAGPPPAISP